MIRSILAVPFLFLLAGCASTGVDLKEPSRLLAQENGVRLDCEVFAPDTLSSTSNVRLVYDITNDRREPIAFAELVPSGTYDPDTLMLTVELGSEVPGNEMAPRLTTIGPGEKKTFDTKVALTFMLTRQLIHPPEGLRVKLAYLDSTAPFQQLIGIPEAAIHSPEIAQALFTPWVEHNQLLITNSLPVRWQKNGFEPPPDR